MATRTQVLALYKRILRTAKTWKATIDSNTTTEQNYIKGEARNLFKLNKNINDEENIKQCIREAEARLDIGE